MFQQVRHHLQGVWRSRSNAGIVLVLSMVFLLVLTMVASTTHVISRTSIKVGSNYSKTVNAFNIAEVGVIRGKSVLRAFIAGASDFDNVLADTYSNSNMLGENASSGARMQDIAYDDGTYTVYVENDPDDISGGGSATNDTDRKVVMTVIAVGKVGNTVEIETFLESLAPGSASVPGVPGAAGICGAESDVSLKGTSLLSGFDWDPPATFACGGTSCAGTQTGAGPDLPPLVTEAALGSNLSKSESFKIEGNPSSVVEDPSMPCDDWADLSNQLASLGTASVYDVDTINGETLGTRSDPEVTIINPPSGTLTMNGTVDGGGVLIITGNTTVDIVGTFHYEGIILILGDDAALNISGTADIFGTVLVNNSNPDSALELEAGGTGLVKYSSAAIQTAIEAIEGATGGGGLLTVAWTERF